MIEAIGGEVVQQCVIPEIAYHGILGRVPVGRASEIMEHREVRLVQCEGMMFLRPVGQCAVPMPEDISDLGTSEEGQRDLPQGEPLLALLDGLPLTGHRLLRGRLTVDDPDGYEGAYQARERVHGTAMASLMCHGDLDEGRGPLRRPVYVRPIMQPHRSSDGLFPEEAIPEGVLPVDLVHRAVRRLYENEGGEPPAAPSVRVVNLSICDRSRPFDRWVSPWARLLDWLSWKYNLLFVVSGGNHPQDIELNIPRAKLQSLTAQDRERSVIEAIAADTRHRRVLSPAETLNGLTIGATHADASPPVQNFNLINPYVRAGLPSTINAHGPGYRRAVKPDILLPGGRQFLSEKLGTTHSNAVLQTTRFIGPPGQRVATPGPSGELDRKSYARGTSNSAALASRWTEFLFDLLDRLRQEHGANLPQGYDVVLLKALLVHGADWADAGAVYASILRTPQNGRTFTEYLGRFLGYGCANVAKVMLCTDQRVTVLGSGQLNDGEADQFLLPLPPSLAASTEKRRLTITLAWLSPVNCMRQNYRVAQLWFDPKNNLAANRICADHRAVQRGTVQHEVLESEQAVDFQDGDVIAVKVNCRADAGEIREPIRYGLVVTLEVAEGIALPIYQEVSARLLIRVPIQSMETT